jgi:hypothetical protein
MSEATRLSGCVEREAPDGEFAHVRAGMTNGPIIVHATSLILTDSEDTLEGEIVASKDPFWDEGETVEVPVEDAANDVDYSVFFEG